MTVEEMEDEAIAQPSVRSLVEIEVEDLFGAFSYRLLANQDPSKLVILYGDNGSGKTTLLECTYHLISPSMDSGHRGYLSRVQFRRFGVRFSGGWKIVIDRPESTKGDYKLSFLEPGQLQPTVLRFDAEKGTFADSRSSELGSFLRRLNVEIYFLRADRTLQADSSAQSRRAERERRLRRANQLRPYDGVIELEAGDDERSSLDQAIAITNDYLRRKSSRAANVGGKSTNSIYEDVVKKIGGPARTLDVLVDPSKESLERRLTLLSERTLDFARFSLMPPLNAQDLLDTIGKAPDDRLHLIASVLEPHLDSVAARLDALESTQRLIAGLVEDVNAFFTNKRIRFSLSSGIQIVSANGTPLAPGMLSSGEKHLLLMFCHTVVAYGKRTLFIIDEPELSLNIKWQHKIVEKLLDVVKDSPMQFIFATHSIELLSQHLDKVVKVVPEITSAKTLE
jgi:energy-coupling factor transporter ATP-binding protein EcfA2